MSILALLNMYSVYYCIAIYDKENKYDYVKKGLFALTILTIILVITLPLNVIYEGDLLDGEGLSYDAVMFHTVLSFIFFFVTASYQGYKKKSIKKVFPFIVLIILYIVSFVIREYYRELIFEGFFYSYILFIVPVKGALKYSQALPISIASSPLCEKLPFIPCVIFNTFTFKTAFSILIVSLFCNFAP